MRSAISRDGAEDSVVLPAHFILYLLEGEIRVDLRFKDLLHCTHFPLPPFKPFCCNLMLALGSAGPNERRTPESPQRNEHTPCQTLLGLRVLQDAPAARTSPPGPGTSRASGASATAGETRP